MRNRMYYILQYCAFLPKCDKPTYKNTVKIRPEFVSYKMRLSGHNHAESDVSYTGFLICGLPAIWAALL